jgi:hypothetical protein
MRLDIPDAVEAEIRRAQRLASAGDASGAEAAYRTLFDQVAHDTAQAVAVLHMWATVIEDPEAKLSMNEESLRRAEADPTFPSPLRATLLANIGYSHRLLGDEETAQRWYLEAKDAAARLGDDDYGASMRTAIDQQLASFDHVKGEGSPHASTRE